MRVENPRDKQRVNRMADLYRSGKTLQEIGTEYGITRERVRQLLSSMGMTRESGGQHLCAVINSKSRHKARLEKQEARYWRIFGCSKDAYFEIETKPWSSASDRRYKVKTAASAYYNQKANSKKRGVSWEINFPDWWRIWKESGHWEERGRGQGYCMARHGDSGPYAVGNVYICTIGQNFSDAYLVHPWKVRFPNGKKLGPSALRGFWVSHDARRDQFNLYVGGKYVGHFQSRSAAEQAGALKVAA